MWNGLEFAIFICIAVLYGVVVHAGRVSRVSANRPFDWARD